MYVAKSLFGKQESRNHCNQIRHQAKIPIDTYISIYKPQWYNFFNHLV